MPLNAPEANVAFDPAELQQRCLNSVALAQRVMQAFLANGAEYVAEIEKYAAGQQWGDVAKAAHCLKGASQNVAAGHLGHLASEIHSSARLNPESLDGLVSALWDAWESFQAHACRFLSSSFDSSPQLSGD